MSLRKIKSKKPLPNMKKLLFLIVCIIFSSCASINDAMNDSTDISKAKNLSVAEIKSQIKINKNDFEEGILVKTKKISKFSNLYDNSEYSKRWGKPIPYYHLRGLKVKAGNVFTIYNTVEFGDINYGYYSSASDKKKNSFKVESLKRNYGGTLGYSEDFLVDVTEKYLRSKKESGIEIRVNGRSEGDDYIIEIPGNYIKAFLEKFDES